MQKVIYYMFLSIAGYLILTNWRGANALLTSGPVGVVKIVKALQGR